MKHKRLIIVFARDQVDKAVSLIEQKVDAEPVITSLNVNAESELRHRGLAFKTAKDYRFSDSDIKEESINWFKTWSNTKISDNKNIKQLLLIKVLGILELHQLKL